MDASTRAFHVYGKTQKGKSALGQSRGSLSPSARQLLILIDGQRSLDELGAFFSPQVLEQSLGALESEGYIEFVRSFPDAEEAFERAAAQALSGFPRDSILPLETGGVSVTAPPRAQPPVLDFQIEEAEQEFADVRGPDTMPVPDAALVIHVEAPAQAEPEPDPAAASAPVPAPAPAPAPAAAPASAHAPVPAAKVERAAEPAAPAPQAQATVQEEEPPNPGKLLYRNAAKPTTSFLMAAPATLKSPQEAFAPEGAVQKAPPAAPANTNAPGTEWKAPPRVEPLVDNAAPGRALEGYRPPVGSSPFSSPVVPMVTSPSSHRTMDADDIIRRAKRKRWLVAKAGFAATVLTALGLAWLLHASEKELASIPGGEAIWTLKVQLAHTITANEVGSGDNAAAGRAAPNSIGIAPSPASPPAHAQAVSSAPAPAQAADAPQVTRPDTAAVPEPGPGTLRFGAGPVPAPSPAEQTAPSGLQLHVRYQETPQLPAHALALGITRGHVVVVLHVDAKGAVSQVELVRATPPEVYDETMQHSFEHWSFDPLGIPGRMTVEIDVVPPN